MSNINFSANQNYKSKLNKLMNMKNNYETDDAYLKLFYEISSHPNTALKLNISNDGSYTLTYNNIQTNGQLTKKQGTMLNAASGFLGLGTQGNTTEGTEGNEDTEGTEGTEGTDGNEGNKEPGFFNKIGKTVTGIMPGTKQGEEEEILSEEQGTKEEFHPEGEGLEEETEEREEREEGESGHDEGEQEPGPGPVEGGKNNRSWWKKALGMSGGNLSDSEYESDESIISSDDEKEDIVPFSTAFFDDDDEEDIMQHIRNMKSKKYLKTLSNTDLRDILRKNNQKVTKNSNYLSKKDMIKSITQFYK